MFPPLKATLPVQCGFLPCLINRFEVSRLNKISGTGFYDLLLLVFLLGFRL